jgi:hypothetical protein
MLRLSTVRRGGLVLGTAALLGTLAACASPVASKYIPPTMAPQQSVDEACGIAGAEVDRVTTETEQQVRASLEAAAADLTAGKMPSLNSFSVSVSVDDTLADIEAQVINPEVLTTIVGVRASLAGFSSVAGPDTLLGVPEYLTSMATQVNQLVGASNDLRKLCGVEVLGSSAESAPSTSDAELGAE